MDPTRIAPPPEQNRLAQAWLASLTWPGEPGGAPPRTPQPADSAEAIVIKHSAMFRAKALRCCQAVRPEAMLDCPGASFTTQVENPRTDGCGRPFSERIRPGSYCACVGSWVS